MSRAKPLQKYTWFLNTSNDPTDWYCDVYENELVWYGHSNHPFWKGPFVVGIQSFDDFLKNGPLDNTPLLPEVEHALKKFIHHFIQKKG